MLCNFGHQSIHRVQPCNRLTNSTNATLIVISVKFQALSAPSPMSSSHSRFLRPWHAPVLRHRLSYRLGERPHKLVAMFELGRHHLFHRLFDPAHCVPQVLQSGVQRRLSVYRQQMRVAGVAFEGSPAGPKDCRGPKQTPRGCDQAFDNYLKMLNLCTFTK